MRKSTKRPDISRFRELLDYDTATGIARWKVNRARRAMKGDCAGSKCPNGYLDVKIDGEHFMLHRVVWAISTGVWPVNDIDHINGQRRDNRLANLRPATRSQNCANRRKTTSGLKGAYYDKRDGSWFSHIRIEGKVTRLGTFKSAAEAHAAYCAAADRLYGEFSCHG